MALVALEFGIQPWDLAQLPGHQQAWLQHVSIWRAERQRERDQNLLDNFARIMGAR